MQDLRQILRTTTKYIDILQMHGIYTLAELLQYMPRSYEDRQSISRIGDLDLQNPTKQSVIAQVIDKKLVNPKAAKKLFEIEVQDADGYTGYIQYYNATFQVAKLEKTKRYVIVGKPKYHKNKLIWSHPECIETGDPRADDDQPSEYTHSNKYGRIYPIYSEMAGVKPSWFADKIYSQIDQIAHIFPEYLPDDIVAQYGLLSLPETYIELHYPTTHQHLHLARQRLYFEKLLRVQIQSYISRQDYQSIQHISSIGNMQDNLTDIRPDWTIVSDIVSRLPYQLTMAQKKVIKQVVEDMHKPKAMLRLLQGDVGSGKTIVSAICAYYMIRKFHKQIAILAPIEVLAIQHYHNLTQLFHPLGINVRLLTGSINPKQKDSLKRDLKYGSIDIVVGTHAIIQENVGFKDIGLVVIDEQHKFGVNQRGFFKRFGSPHILQMTATPIPRSLALAYFAEFDVSVIDEMPAGRKPIITKVISKSDYKKIKPWILDRITKGQNVFVVVPLIEMSETMDGVSDAASVYMEVVEMFEQDILHIISSQSEHSSHIYTDDSIANNNIYMQDNLTEDRDISQISLSPVIGLMHGRLKSDQKQKVMQDFKNNKTKILVSTTVIEVGVDIPHATIMIIKNAERFGLSQLHQLRGRVGRSDIQSYCFLETKNKSGNDRLSAMEQYHDGFKLAQIDLQLRGSGEILGTRQSGDSDIPIDIITDVVFIEKVQSVATEIMHRYPDLTQIPAIHRDIYITNQNILA